jgi:DNA repair protein RadC
MLKELRDVTKSFRTTKETVAKLNELKKNDTYKTFSESDIMNLAMETYVSNIKQQPLMHMDKYKNITDIEKIQRLHQLQKESNRLLEELGDKRKIELKSARQTIDYIRTLCPMNMEVTYVIYLDYKLKFIDFKRIHEGGLHESLMNIRTIIKEAFDIGADSIVLLHNHPSGIIKPSGEDIIMTEKMFFACECVALKLADSVIIGHGRKYYSFNNEGWIDLFSKRFKKTVFKKKYDMKKLAKISVK